MKIPPNTPNKTKEKPIEAQKPIIFAKSNDLISKTKEGIADIYTASQELHPAERHTVLALVILASATPIPGTFILGILGGKKYIDWRTKDKADTIISLRESPPKTNTTPKESIPNTRKKWHQYIKFSRQKDTQKMK